MDAAGDQPIAHPLVHVAADAVKALLADDVLYAAGVLGSGLFAHAQAHQPVGDEQVALQHALRLCEPIGG